MSTRKKEGNRPHFRSAAKRAAFEYLETHLKAAHRKLADARGKLYVVQRDIREAKRDIAGISQVIQEYKK